MLQDAAHNPNNRTAIGVFDRCQKCLKEALFRVSAIILRVADHANRGCRTKT
jgi:hypothetical protein